MTKHTVVQHTGYAVGENPTFRQGLESRSVNTKKEQSAIAKAGGVLFDSYDEAEAYAESEMYQPNNTSLVPHAPGTFSELTVDGLAIYVPRRSDDRTWQTELCDQLAKVLGVEPETIGTYGRDITLTLEQANDLLQLIPEDSNG